MAVLAVDLELTGGDVVAEEDRLAGTLERRRVGRGQHRREERVVDGGGRLPGGRGIAGEKRHSQSEEERSAEDRGQLTHEPSP